MATEYSRECMKVVVAKMAETIGFHGINTIPLEVLADLLHRYMQRLAKDTQQYAELCGRTTPIDSDLAMTFKDLGITSSSLEEYMNCVDPVPFPVDVPKIPVPRASDLNFLKPGSQEILSRPINIHDHLPPMNPVTDENSTGGIDGEEDFDSDKRTDSPNSPGHPKNTNPAYRSKKDDEGQPVREMDSIMMTTSGFISSSKTARLPEPRPPNIPLPLIHTSAAHSRESLAKKKVATMEKIKQHKSSQGQSSNPNRSKTKDGKIRPKIPGAPPGTGSIKPSSSKVTPKLKMPAPKSKTPEDDPRDPSYVAERDSHREENRHKQRDGKREEQKKREFLKEKKRERIRMRMRGLSKEEELKRYKEREEELLAALEASKTTALTNPIRVREKTPESDSRKKAASAKKSRSNNSTPRSDTNFMIDIRNIKEEKMDPPEEEIPMPSSSENFMFEHPHMYTPPTIPPIPYMNTPSPTVKPPSKSRSSRKPSPSKSPKRLKKVKIPPKPVSRPESSPVREPPTSSYVPSPPSEASSAFSLPVIPNNPSFIPSFTKFEKNYQNIVEDRPISVPPFSPLYNPMSPQPDNFAHMKEPLQDPPPPPLEETSMLVEPHKSSSKPEKKKEHKKDKKNKDKDKDKDRDSDHSKSKKKKDKKDKDRSKEEKRRLKEQLKLEKKEKKREKKEGSPTVPKIFVKFQSEESTSQLSNVSGSMEPPKPPKLVIKPIRKNPEEESEKSPPSKLRSDNEPGSPEIAKISPLMTRPVKPPLHIKSPTRPTVPPLKIRDPTAKRSEKKDKKRKHSMVTPEVIEKEPKESFTCSVLPEEPPRKQPRKMSPPESPPVKKQPSGLLTETVGPIGHFVDDQGNEVWICPQCGKQDDGSPMIGCDACDDWYHWVCVGIHILPNENENWYCPRCLAKQRDANGHDKKKKNRKKKV